MRPPWSHAQPAPHGDSAAEELEPYLVSVVGEREPWRQWAKDPESFERAVLAHLEQKVGGHTPELMREPAGRELRGVHLEGAYPNTEIVVSYVDLRTGNEKESRWLLWADRYIVDKTMFDPEAIADEVWMWLIEPLGGSVLNPVAVDGHHRDAQQSRSSRGSFRACYRTASRRRTPRTER
jgi:hypothetical protein